MTLINPNEVFQLILGSVPTVRSSNFKEFEDCLGQRLDDYKGLVEKWARTTRPVFNGTVSPALDHVTAIFDELNNDLRAAEDFICLQQTIKDTNVGLQGDFTGMLADVQACLETAFNLEGLKMSLSLEEIVAYLQEKDAEATAAIVAATTRRDILQERINMMRESTFIAGLVDAPENPYLAAIVTSKIVYLPGEIITYEIATNKATSSIIVEIPRDDLDPPVFQAVPESAITRLSAGHFEINAQFPADYLGERFRVKHQLSSGTGDYSLFFARFEKERNPAGPRPAWKLRPCPPA